MTRGILKLHLIRGCTRRPGEPSGADEPAWKNVREERQIKEKEAESEEERSPHETLC